MGLGGELRTVVHSHTITGSIIDFEYGNTISRLTFTEIIYDQFTCKEKKISHCLYKISYSNSAIISANSIVLQYLKIPGQILKIPYNSKILPQILTVENARDAWNAAIKLGYKPWKMMIKEGEYHWLQRLFIRYAFMGMK